MKPTEKGDGMTLLELLISGIVASAVLVPVLLAAAVLAGSLGRRE